MTRAEVRQFIEDGVEAITPVHPFGSGLLTEFNANRSNEYPNIWYESLDDVSVELVNQTLPEDGWPIKLHIANKDSMDSVSDQYELIIDACDYVAQQLIRQYNQILDGSDSIVIESITRKPFVKKYADVLTGVLLTFTLKSPDKTNLC